MADHLLYLPSLDSLEAITAAVASDIAVFRAIANALVSTVLAHFPTRSRFTTACITATGITIFVVVINA